MEQNIAYEVRTYQCQRKSQQDYYGFHRKDNLFLAVLCDGMGGHDGGSDASHMAVNSLIKSAETINIDNIPGFFVKSVKKMNSNVKALGETGKYSSPPGTTIVSCIIYENQLYWLSVGDSILYIFRNNELVQITNDHNLRSTLGKPCESDNERGDALVSYLGVNKLKLIDINLKQFELCKNDIILLATDGLYKNFGDKRIRETLAAGGTVEEIADSFEKQIETGSGRFTDNTTFIVIATK